MAPAFWQAQEISGGRSGLLLFGKSCQTKNKSDTGAPSRPLTCCNQGLIRSLRNRSILVVGNDVKSMRLAAPNEQVTPKALGVSRTASWMKWFSRIWNIENIKI